MSAQRRTAVLSVLLPLAAVALVWLFLVTYGTWNLVGEEWLSATYDSLARSLLRGEVTVDPDAIKWEGIKVGDRVVAYHAPFPALLRVVPNLLFPDMYGKWSRFSCLLAALLAGGAFSALILRAASGNAGLTNRQRAWLVGWSVAGFGLASPIVYLISTARLYHEPILWALAWSLIGTFLTWELLRTEDPSAWALVGLALCASAGMLTRLVSGVPLAVIWVLMAAVWWRRLATRKGGTHVRRLVPVLAGVAVLGAAVAFTGWYNQARFGSIWKVLDYRGFYLDPTAVGGEFDPRRLPSGLVNYFGFFPSYFSSEPPFLRMAPSLYLDPAVFIEWKEETISLPFGASWLVVGGVLGLVAAGKRRRWTELVVTLPFAAQAVFILGFYFITQRYEGELLPWLLCCYALHVAHWRFDGSPGRILLRVLPAMVCLSAFASVASTLDFHMRLSGDTPHSYKLRLNRILWPRPRFEAWNGHRMYLSDLAPVSTTFKLGEMGLDTSFDGKVLEVQGLLLPKGLGMHAVGMAVYRVPEGAVALEALVGMPTACPGSKGSVVFEVLDQDGGELFTSGIIRNGEPGRVIRVPLQGVREVTLKVGDGGDGIDCDHAPWGEVAFLVP
ncbi:MAG: NPCBM/NEW2 domain-containing protein [Thermoanaerobaculaceae bacterium]|jgi:hypothetical protein|nr:NPCBM/NEW2 domain-containing protein [Thermoanaerobaculaceae bacterium]